ncbi:MAG: hypothetical protein ACRYF3_14860 [Janthinobacterium lividum]
MEQRDWQELSHAVLPVAWPLDDTRVSGFSSDQEGHLTGVSLRRRGGDTSPLVTTRLRGPTLRGGAGVIHAGRMMGEASAALGELLADRVMSAAATVRVTPDERGRILQEANSAAWEVAQRLSDPRVWSVEQLDLEGETLALWVYRRDFDCVAVADLGSSTLVCRGEEPSGWRMRWLTIHAPGVLTGSPLVTGGP